MTKWNIHRLKELKNNGEKIAMITAYDYPTACLAEEAGVEMILVGDSLGMVVLGYRSTQSVTLADMIHQGRAVMRGQRSALVVIDMPFLTYHISPQEALRNAGRLIQETGADAVKVEGGAEIVPVVEAVTRAGIPVMGHLGLTPQSVGALGGYKVQGRGVDEARRIIDDARALEAAGAFSVVLECVPWQLGRLVSQQVRMPVIGIGAGGHCDGQVLVFHDLLALYPGRRPRFALQFTSVRDEVLNALGAYVQGVKANTFPAAEHCFSMPEGIAERLG